jgi:hypothetical protein
MNPYSHSDTHAQTRSHVHMHPEARTHTHTRTHTRTHTHTHPRAHTRAHSDLEVVAVRHVAGNGARLEEEERVGDLPLDLLHLRALDTTSWRHVAARRKRLLPVASIKHAL